MSNWTKNLKSTGSDRPKLNHRKLKIKEVDGGGLLFAYYDSETKTDVPVESPLNVAVIGSALQLSAFDNQMQKSYRSTYVFDTKAKTTQVYKPDGNAMFDHPTTYAEAKDALMAAAGAATKVKYIWFLYDLDNNQTYGVESNVSVSIEINKGIKNHINNGMSFTVTPTEYHKDDERISKKTREMLGKLADKNKPKFAWFELGKPIEDDVAESSGLVDAIKEYNLYSAVAIPPTVDKEDTVYAPKEESHIDGLMKRTKIENTPDLEPSSTEDDDLPF